MIFFAFSLLLAWIVGFVQGDHNFSASTGCLTSTTDELMRLSHNSTKPGSFGVSFRRYYDLGNLNNYTCPGMYTHTHTHSLSLSLSLSRCDK